MIKCKNCDHVISDDANFCPVCGSRLEIDAKARESETAEHEGRRPVIEPKLASRSLGVWYRRFCSCFFLMANNDFLRPCGSFFVPRHFFRDKKHENSKQQTHRLGNDFWRCNGFFVRDLFRFPN